MMNFASTEADDSFVDFDFSECVSKFKGIESLYDMAIIAKLSETETKYVEMRKQVEELDKKFAKNVVENPLIQLLKSGIIWKKSDGAFNKWEERFLLLSNCGLLYFKSGHAQPQKFKLLN